MKGKYESGLKKKTDKRNNSGKTRKLKDIMSSLIIRVTRSSGLFFGVCVSVCVWARNKHHIYCTNCQKKKKKILSFTLCLGLFKSVYLRPSPGSPSKYLPC